MDPTTALAVAGTALQFTETAFKIARFLYIYFTDVKKAPEQAEKLHEEITMMVGIVASLKITLETYPSRIPASQEEALKTAINGSVKIMEELLIKLEDHSEITHATGIRKAKWPLKKREIEGICKEMEKHKRTLSFALAVERLYSPVTFISLTRRSHADRHIDEIVSKSLSHHLSICPFLTILQTC